MATTLQDSELAVIYKKPPSVELELRMPERPTRVESHRGRCIEHARRPAIAVYCSGSPGPGVPTIRVALEHKGWEIGLEIVLAGGVLRFNTERSWRRLGEEIWRYKRDGGDMPPRRIREVAIAPYRELISSMIEEARSLHPDWAQIMREWHLTEIKDARGSKRTFDTADARKRDGEENDSWISHRLNVSDRTPAVRRWRDSKDELGGVPWAITNERLREIDAADGQSVPGALIGTEISSDDPSSALGESHDER